MRGRKHSEPLILISFKIKRTTYQALRALYPRVGYSEILRRLAEAHVAKKITKEVNDVTGDVEGAVREAAK